ncbi:MAG: sulfotransferase [Pseudomonadota bacterium]
MLKIVAIIMARNAGATLRPVLAQLFANDIDVAVIDHGSTDETPALLDDLRGRIAVIEQAPFDGVFRLADQLRRKRDVMARLPADWIIHLDADEILESPVPGETLRAFVERADADGADAIDCDEFVFVPIDETETFEGSDFVSEMRHYYHFQPPGRPLQRVFRANRLGPAWDSTGGHRALGDTSRDQDAAAGGGRLAAEKLRHRHYIGLSLAHLQRQYLSRVFAAEELQRGWHLNRVSGSELFIKPPDKDRLFNLDRDGWRVDRPEPRHLIFADQAPYRPPQAFSSADDPKPAPFIVGVGRSGTTLLRLLLDAHTQLAIPPETHWLPAMLGLETETTNWRDAASAALASSHNWQDMGFGEDDVHEMLAPGASDTPVDFIREIYRRYAARHNATRWGDKTPIHQLSMEMIARQLPEARFIHMIRDGRDVAASHKGLWFGPGDDMRRAARMWIWRISLARQSAQFLPHYLEVRYEDLVRDPRTTLQRICEFIDLPFQESQLAAHERAEGRLAELDDLKGPRGLIDARRRQSIHEWTNRPPDSSRIGRWRTILSTEEVETFQTIAADFLTELGYERG